MWQVMLAGHGSVEQLQCVNCLSLQLQLTPDSLRQMHEIASMSGRGKDTIFFLIMCLHVPNTNIPHPSPLTPHPSPLTPHPSPLTLTTHTGQKLIHIFDTCVHVNNTHTQHTHTHTHLTPHTQGKGFSPKELSPQRADL